MRICKCLRSFAPLISMLILVVSATASLIRGQVSLETEIQADDVVPGFFLDRGALGLYQSLRRLHTRASVLMVTAHPDDEDGGMLTFESRGRGTRAAIFCLTRGEGGANVMSNDFFDALGLVRTQELVAASRYYGVRPYWARVIDYGFSKAKDEAFEKWGRERTLYDAVRVVRLMRPLVLTSVFIGGPTDGHGNHQTTGQITQEVFRLAGDPGVFPEQLRQGLRPWNPLKVYARVPRSLRKGALDGKGLYNYATQKWSAAGFRNYVDGSWTTGALPTTVEISTGDYDPVLGFNYLQVSREGLGQQKCQTGGPSIPPSGAFTVPYHRFSSRVVSSDTESSFYDGIDISLAGIATLVKDGNPAFLREGLEQINGFVERAMSEFVIDKPERVAPFLAEGLRATNSLIKRVRRSPLSERERYDVVFELEVKRSQFNRALQQALGLSMLAAVVADGGPSRAGFVRLRETFQTAVPGQAFSVEVRLNNQSGTELKVGKVSLEVSEDNDWTIAAPDAAAAALAHNRPLEFRFQVEVGPEATFTKPYFTRPNVEQPYYDVLDERWRNLSQRPYPLTAWADLIFKGVEVRIGQVVQSVRRVTGQGTVLEPLVVAPPISVSLEPHSGVVPLDASSFELAVSVKSNVKGPAMGHLRLELPEGWHSSPESVEFSMLRDGETQSLAFEVVPANLSKRRYLVGALATYRGREYRDGFKTAGYPGLRPYNLYRPAQYSASGVDLKIAHDLRIAYIMGTGDDVPRALENLGVKVIFLSDQDLASADLSRFDLILLGVRTYAARPALATYNGRLLEYVKGGGVVVVQYNTPEFDKSYGPYPYSMTRSPEEVTDEQSRMKILKPQSPVFTWPNQITENDFEGWVEERGSKFFESWDSGYEALLETQDPDQEPQRGGLMYARFGQGVYIYCAYALYRQLPHGVPGAYRLFANLISLPDHPELRREQ